MGKYVIGSDLGTTNLKSVLTDESGNVVSQAVSGYPLSTPKEGYAEQDPEQWWKAFKETVQVMLQEAKIRAEDIKAVCISSQSSTVLPLDRQGRPLRSAIIWMDNRGKEYCPSIQEKIRAVNKNNFNNVEEFFTVSKLVWLKKHQPEIYRNASVFIQANSYIIFRLTGVYSIDRAEAGLQHLIDIDNEEYSADICRALDLDPNKFPPIKDCSKVVGEVTSSASRETLLAAGTPVTAGTVDTSAAALAAGTITDGQVFYSAGTSGNLCYCSGSLCFDKSYFVFPHAKESLWLFDMLMGTVGISVEWLCRIIGSMDKKHHETCLEELNRRIEKNTQLIGNPIFLPFLSGQLSPEWKTNARGVFFGLNINTTEAQLARAIMEGCAFEARDNITTLNKLGFAVEEIRLVGGVTKSEVWNQIWADVLNLPVLIPHTSGSAYGNALLAGEMVGVYPKLENSIDDFIAVEKRYIPEQKRVDFYREAYTIYRTIVDKIRPVYNEYEVLQRNGDE